MTGFPAGSGGGWGDAGRGRRMDDSDLSGIFTGTVWEGSAQYNLWIDPSVRLGGYIDAEGPFNINGPGEISTPLRIGFFSYIGRNATITGDVEIGRYCSIGWDVTIGPTNHPPDFLSTHLFSFCHGGPFDQNAFYQNLNNPEDHTRNPPTVIGNDVWIGAKATIMRGVRIGDGAIIGSGAVVTRDVEPYAIVGGVPARVIRKRFDDELIEKLLKLKWYNYNIGTIAPNLKDMVYRNVDLGCDIIRQNIECGLIPPVTVTRFRIGLVNGQMNVRRSPGSV